MSINTPLMLNHHLLTSLSTMPWSRIHPPKTTPHLDYIPILTTPLNDDTPFVSYIGDNIMTIFRLYYDSIMTVL